MVGDDSFTIKPRLGEYLLLHKNQGKYCDRTLFPVPDPKKGKGVLVQKTLWGNLILGPTSRDVHDPDTLRASNEEINAYILSRCKQLVPSFDPGSVIHSFAGIRAKSSRGDWIIEPALDACPSGRFVHAAGIDSPGLAGSPAIAVAVTDLLRASGLELEADPDFDPYRAPLIRVKDGWRGLKSAAPPATFGDDVAPEKRVVCKCEKVTEAEVRECVRRGLPVDSTQAIRKRVRGGMGHCQGDPQNYDCESRIAAIIADELDMPQTTRGVGRRPWPATTTLKGRWPSDGERDELRKLSEAAVA
eukprot:g1930.t1